MNIETKQFARVLVAAAFISIAVAGFAVWLALKLP